MASHHSYSESQRRPSLAEKREAALTAARNERDRFKRDANLLAYAASRGYVPYTEKTSLNFPALRHPTTGHKIVVGKGQDKNWVFYTLAKSGGPQGSILDFIQHLEGGKDQFPLTKVLQELREWTNTPRELPVFAQAQIHHIPKDLAAVSATVEHARTVPTHPYLESRGLTRETLDNPRFRNHWLQSGERRDERDLPSGTVLFPHRDDKGLCGYETKSWRFTGFARGGSKALWWSAATPTDNRLVIAESALDALSYHALDPNPRTRYVSFAGEMNARQPELLERAISWMPRASTIAAATDNDKSGHEFARRIEHLASGYPHVRFERHTPTLGKDWNDQLRALCNTKQHETPSRASIPPRRDASRDVELER